MVAQSCPWAMHKSGPDNTNMCFYQDSKGGTSLSHFYRRWQEASGWMVILVVKSWQDLLTWRSLGARKKSDKMLCPHSLVALGGLGTLRPEKLFPLEMCVSVGEKLSYEQSLQQPRWKIHRAWGGDAHSWKHGKAAVTHTVGSGGLVSFRSLERWRCMAVPLGFLSSLSSLTVDNRRLQLLPMHTLCLCCLSYVWSILLFGTEGEARFVSYLGIFKLTDSFFRQFLPHKTAERTAEVPWAPLISSSFSLGLTSCMESAAHFAGIGYLWSREFLCYHKNSLCVRVHSVGVTAS